jgi:hypothetical protein
VTLHSGGRDVQAGVKTMNVDYGQIITDSLNGVAEIKTANENEAAARTAHAALFTEAMKACSEATRKGFPLILTGANDDFVLTTGPIVDARAMVIFKRKGQVLLRSISGVAPAAMGDAQVETQWAPNGYVQHEIDELIQQMVADAARVLAKHYAVASRSS